MNDTPARSTTSIGDPSGQALAEQRRRVAVDLAHQHERPVAGERQVEVFLLCRHGGTLPPRV